MVKDPQEPVAQDKRSESPQEQQSALSLPEGGQCFVYSIDLDPEVLV